MSESKVKAPATENVTSQHTVFAQYVISQIKKGNGPDRIITYTFARHDMNNGGDIVHENVISQPIKPGKVVMLKRTHDPEEVDATQAEAAKGVVKKWVWTRPFQSAI